MDEMIQGNEDVVIFRDMNGQVGSEKRGYERIHRGYGFFCGVMKLEKKF